MKIENIRDLETELMKIFSKEIMIFIAKERLFFNFEYENKLYKLFRLKFNKDILEVRFEEDYSDEKFKEYYLILIRFFQNNNIKFKEREDLKEVFNFLNLFKKNKNEKENVYSYAGDARCPETEKEFYYTLRNDTANDKYRSGPLIYFNSKLVGILKIEGNFHFLCFNDLVLKKNMFFSLPNDIESEIYKKYHSGRDNEWFRVNLIGEHFPVNLNPKVKAKKLYDFSDLKYCKRFPEIYKKSDDEIFKQFEFWINECVKENDILIKNEDFDYVRKV